MQDENLCKTVHVFPKSSYGEPGSIEPAPKISRPFACLFQVSPCMFEISCRARLDSPHGVSGFVFSCRAGETDTHTFTTLLSCNGATGSNRQTTLVFDGDP